MKLTLASLLALLAPANVAMYVVAHDVPPQDRISAVRELEQAKSDLRNYWLVEYPRKLRELDAAIEMTEKEIASNKTLAREYRPFNRFSTGNPFPITQRNLELCARSAELRLDSLRTERNNLVRFHSDQIRALTARIIQARNQLQAIDAAIVASATAVEPLPEKRQVDQLSQ